MVTWSLFLLHLSARMHHVQVAVRLHQVGGLVGSPNLGVHYLLLHPADLKWWNDKVYGPYNLEMESRKWLKTETSDWNSVDITQWFSTGDTFVHQETFGNMGHFWLSQLRGGVLLASSRQRPGMLLNTHPTVPSTASHNKEICGPKVSSAEDEKSGEHVTSSRDFVNNLTSYLKTKTNYILL